MPLIDKQRREIDTRRPNYKGSNYAVFRRRRRIGLLILILLAALVVGLPGAYFVSGTSEETSEAPPEQVDEPAVEETPEDKEAEEKAAEKKAAEEKAAKEEEERRATMAPEDPTLFLTVPRLGLYNHTVRNDASEFALDLGAIKLPETGFPWQKESTNTYIACHRLGWPGNESFNQCLNLPAMQVGDRVVLSDTLGRVYEYRVSNILQVTPEDTWVKKPVAGKDVVSLQTCIETLGDVFTMGPNWSARFIVQAERVN